MIPDPAITVFDRVLYRRRRDRAAVGFEAHDFLHREIAERLADRLADVKREFRSALLIGGAGFEDVVFAKQPDRLISMDVSPSFASRARGVAIAADEEFLPFAPASFDVAVSLLSLHAVNDLPGALIQIRQALKPDGLLLAALFGGGTLQELRESWMQAEIETRGGASPRVAPFPDARTLGGLSQRAGFALPVVDCDRLTATYADPFKLMRELRGMGEANALTDRDKSFTRRATLMSAAGQYRSRFGDADGRVPASFEICVLTAWSPHESQPKPLRPGSAKASLADALKRHARPA